MQPTVDLSWTAEAQQLELAICYCSMSQHCMAFLAPFKAINCMLCEGNMLVSHTRMCCAASQLPDKPVYLMNSSIKT